MASPSVHSFLQGLLVCPAHVQMHGTCNISSHKPHPCYGCAQQLHCGHGCVSHCVRGFLNADYLHNKAKLTAPGLEQQNYIQTVHYYFTILWACTEQQDLRILSACGIVIPKSTINSTVSTVLIPLTRSSAIAEGPREVSCQLKSCQLPHNSAVRTSSEQIEVMKLEG